MYIKCIAPFHILVTTIGPKHVMICDYPKIKKLLNEHHILVLWLTSMTIAGMPTRSPEKLLKFLTPDSMKMSHLYAKNL